MMHAVYVITDPDLLPGHRLLEGVSQALQAGIKLIQYRDKTADRATALQNAQALLDLCRDFQAQLIINDHVDIAAKCGAHGVHLGQEDGNVSAARQLLGSEAIIGITCHDQLALAKQAELAGANYVAFGRFFSSNTKPDASLAALDTLTQAKRSLSIPIVGIGGIDQTNAQLVLQSGANSVATCHAVFAGPDIHGNCKRLLRAVSAH